MNDYHAEFVMSHEDARAGELAREYHAACEGYDEMVCSGRSRGEAMPICARELALVNANASRVRREIYDKARVEGIGQDLVRKAISRASLW